MQRPSDEPVREITEFIDRSPDADDETDEFQAYDYRDSLPARPGRALSLFVLTCMTTWIAGVAGVGQPYALQFSGALMLILLCHELGHYIQARRYGVPATLPYFIPFLPPFGTLGAIIFQGAGVANRKSLYDIAITGPLAGLVVALPVCYFGCLEAEYFELAQMAGKETQVFGDPLLLQWMLEWIHGPKVPGTDVNLAGNPLLFAGWIGIFITGLNLVPIGQLDGGHVLYTLIGKRAHYVAMGLLAIVVAYMVWSEYYAFSLMVVLLLLMGPKHPPTADDSVPLGWPRVILGWVTLSFIVIGITPKPLDIVVIEPVPAPEGEQLPPDGDENKVLPEGEPDQKEDEEPQERPGELVVRDGSGSGRFSLDDHQFAAMFDPDTVREIPTGLLLQGITEPVPFDKAHPLPGPVLPHPQLPEAFPLQMPG